jgi:DDE superfamily endonuclease
MDPASQALAQTLPPQVRRTYAALAERCEVRVSRTTVWYRDNGRPSRQIKAAGQQYLTPSEEKAFVRHILKTAALGFPLRMKDIPPLAFSIARRRSPTKAIKPPHKNWPQAFAKRHPELKSRKNRAICWDRHDNNIYDKVVSWFEVIGPELSRRDILAENIYNMDETGVMLSKLGSVTVLVSKDDRRDYRGAGEKRTMVTAIECVSASGEYLHPMIIWPASTHRSNWTTYKTPGWVYSLSESGYNDSYLSLEWMKRIFDPQTKARANQKPRMLICDGFGTHETLEMMEFCFENNIILCRLPSHTSHKLQPCDVSVFSPLKTAYRDQVERLYRSGVTVVNKEHFTSLYDPARTAAMTKKNILAGWAKAGLFPFNPDRVIRGITKPAVPQPIRTACEDQVPLQSENFQTPATPVSSEALTTLLNLIKEAPRDKTSEMHHQHLVQKLANAAQTSFAQQALDQDHIQFLSKMNNEAKTRRKTRSDILGKARVMTYEDIEAARATRAEKDAAKEARGKRKRGRPKKVAVEAEEATVDKRTRKKRRCATQEAEEALVVQTSRIHIAEEEEAEASEVQTSGTHVAEEESALQPYRAPVARMY